MAELTEEQKAAIANSRARTITPAQQAAIDRVQGVTAPEEPLGFTQRVGQDFDRRKQNIGGMVAESIKGNQGYREGAMQAAGQGFAAVGDVVGEGITSVGRGLSAITPDPFEDEVINQLGIFFDQPLMQAGKRALEQGMEAWAAFSEENPRAARNIEAVTNISGGGLATLQGGKVLSRTLQQAENAAAREARGLIEGGGYDSVDSSTARFRLEEIPDNRPVIAPRQNIDSDWNEVVEPRSETGVRMRAVESPEQIRAIKQGFDEGLIAMIREASPVDRQKMLKSLEITEKSKRNLRYGMDERASNIAGRSIMDRYKIVKSRNTEAGQSIGRYAKNNMQSTIVDVEPSVEAFRAGLDDMGIVIKDDLTLDFSNASIENLSGIENFLSNIVKRMSSNRKMTAYEVHQFKKFIDAQVSYGKVQEGLSGKAESIVKDLRYNLNKMLGDEFPEYGALNKTYSESIDAINELQRLVPRADLSSDDAAKQVGILLRRLDSNAASQSQVEEMIGALDDLGNKYGGSFTDDVKTQVKFAFELDKIFGTTRSGSMSGQIGEALANSPRTSTAASELARIAAEKLRGVNQKAAFESMQELLNSFD
jgi:hypothetical protein